MACKRSSVPVLNSRGNSVSSYAVEPTMPQTDPRVLCSAQMAPALQTTAVASQGGQDFAALLSDAMKTDCRVGGPGEIAKPAICLKWYAGPQGGERRHRRVRQRAPAGNDLEGDLLYLETRAPERSQERGPDAGKSPRGMETTLWRQGQTPTALTNKSRAE